MEPASASLPINSACEIVSSRTFNVARELVFEAWSNPEHLKAWWGPAGFTNTFNEFDFRVGGHWRFVMHGPDKGNYTNECEFTIIERPSVIAWRRHSKPLFQVLATFDALSGNSTRLLFRMVFDTEGECNKIKPFAVEKNEENFDKLEVELKQMLAKSE